MIRAFVDASVLYSAAVSASGASRELLRLHRSNQIQLVVSAYVVLEARRNLTEDFPGLAQGLDLLVDVLLFEISETTQQAIVTASEYTEFKDAPVVAAAIDGHCEYLLTFDRKHLINRPEVAKNSGLKIITPGDMLHVLRELR